MAVVNLTGETHLSTNYQNTGSDQNLWHLDRVDERQIDDGGLDRQYAWCSNYGKSVRAYILDTGIYAAHQEFSNGIVDAGYDATTSDGTPSNPCPNVKGSSPIYASHGTWVASVLAGHTVGAGKHTRLVPVRCLTATGQERPT